MSNGDNNTRPCPHCSHLVSTNYEFCPNCGRYLRERILSFGGKPMTREQETLLHDRKVYVERIERPDLQTDSTFRHTSVKEAMEQIKSPGILWRIEKLARFWEDADDKPVLAYERHMEDLLSGLSEQRKTFTYIICGDGKQVEVMLGDQDNSDVLKPLLIGLYPGIGMSERRVKEKEKEDAFLNGYLKKLCSLDPKSMSEWAYTGVLSGIPAIKSGRQQKEGQEDRGDVRQIERLIRGMSNCGKRWWYLVIACPDSSRSGDSYSTELQIRLAQISQASSVSRSHFSTFKAIKDEPIEWVNRQAKRDADLLEVELRRADIAKVEGWWKVQVYYGTEDKAIFDRLTILLRSCFSGDEHVPQPLRVYQCTQNGTKDAKQDAETRLTSRELARYCNLPREEFSGYQVVPYARFAVTSPGMRSDAEVVGDSIDIGSIVDGATILPEQRYAISMADLTAHTLVAGATGSGKTNTCLYLLSQLANQGIPFLVIEPINAELNEYRSLAPLFNSPQYQSRGCKQLRVFTLGDTTSPFSLNPLEIEEGSTVEAHISRLLTCFKAAMPMWQPLPAVFLTALQRTYIDAGILPGTRIGFFDGKRFPTMHDFAYHLAYVAEHEVMHSDEVRSNILGASVLRIRGLLSGSAGRLLTARQSLPMDDILDNPTILELRHIGDDGDKALLIALILMQVVAAQERRFRNVQPLTASPGIEITFKIGGFQPRERVTYRVCNPNDQAVNNQGHPSPYDIAITADEGGVVNGKWQIPENASAGKWKIKVSRTGEGRERHATFTVIPGKHTRQYHETQPAHVILIEEAHRLLSDVSSGTSEQYENTRGEAAQAFAHLIAETRKYGQGVIIAEQLPVKLIRDVIGNTGLKIMHLLTAKEDREILAAAMRMNRHQTEAGAGLPTGHAIVYSRGQESPVCVAVPNVSSYFEWRKTPPFNDDSNNKKSVLLALLSNQDVREHMQRILTKDERDQYDSYQLPFSGCDLCRSRCTSRSLGEAVVHLERGKAEFIFGTENTSLDDKIELILEISKKYIKQRSTDQEYCTTLHLIYAVLGNHTPSEQVRKVVDNWVNSKERGN